MQLFLPSPAPQPLTSRTNVHATRSPKVHFKLPVIKKAAPTVSVTNTNAAARLGVLTVHPPCALGDDPSSSAVPFPSDPIPCPSRKRAHSDDGYEGRTGEMVSFGKDQSKGSALPFHRRISHIDILRRRSKSCIPSSLFNCDPQASQAQAAAPIPFPSGPSKQAPPAPVPGSRRRSTTRRESMSAGTPMPASRHPRKARRIAHDAHFLASMHSSIALHVRAAGAGSSSLDDYTAQDAALVERIWNNLIDMGYRPVPLDAPSPAPSAPTSDPAREAAERAAQRTRDASSTPVQDLPPPSDVVPVPQLVATLIMRHRDRAATRPRSSSKRAAEEIAAPQLAPRRSPLSTTILADCPMEH